MGKTTEYQLPWPELPDAADGPDGFENLATATETALKGFGTLLTGSSSSGQANPSQWITAVELNSTNMAAGQYMIFAHLWWSANWGTDGYTWTDLNANGESLFVGTLPCRTGGDGTPPAFHTWAIPHRHKGGKFQAWLRYGFSVTGVTLRNARLTALRVGS